MLPTSSICYPYPPSSTLMTPSNSFQRLEPKVLLLQIRQSQSKWYQKLFQSDPKALAEPWLSRAEDLNDMLHWSSDLLNISSPLLQQFFQSELLYSNILIIWPPKSPAVVCTYGKALVFQNAIEYARTVWTMCMSPDLNFLSSLHIARTLIVGKRLLAVLRVSSDPITSLISLQDPSIPPSRSTLPSITKQSLESRLEDAIRGIQWFNAILEALDRRFGNATESRRFQRESVSVLQLLLSYHNQQVVQTTEATSGSLPIPQIGVTSTSMMPSWNPMREENYYMPR